MHSFTLSVSHTVFHFLFFSPCPSGIGGFPVTWGLDSPSHVLTLVLSYLFLSLQAISFPFPRLDAHLALPFFLSSCSQASVSRQGFLPAFICVFAACLWRGSFAGRKAGWWPLRSAVTQVRCKRCPWGACVSLPLWNAKEHQFSVLALPHKLMLHTLAKGHLSERTYVGLKQTKETREKPVRYSVISGRLSLIKIKSKWWTCSNAHLGPCFNLWLF